MKWPDFLEKKEKLFSPKTTKEEAGAWGDRYLEANRLHDAVAFYRRAQRTDGLERIRNIAVETGDFQLYEETVPEGDWENRIQEIKNLARRAEELGRFFDAKRAYERIGDEVGRRRAEGAISALLGRDGPPGGQSSG